MEATAQDISVMAHNFEVEQDMRLILQSWIVLSR
jgi:hypothetical protein